MGVLEFQKLPVNTLVGADWKTFKGITQGQTIGKGYKTKYQLTKAICRLLSCLKPIQDRRYDKRLKNQAINMEPVFILGHWRSGTTFVHNVLAHDKHFGYTTTYQTVFPHMMMWGQPMFKKTMAWLMPDKRPTDNMELNVDLPQEEEFALSNMMPCSYYDFWFLPQNMLEYCDRFLTMKTATPEEHRMFRETFLKLIKISLWNTQGSQFLSKNPPHTGKVKESLYGIRIYPEFFHEYHHPFAIAENFSGGTGKKHPRSIYPFVSEI